MLRRRTAPYLAAAAIVCGCAREPQTDDRFIPSPNLARAALEAALVDWSEGLPAGQIDRLAVTVRVIDSQRKKGQTLDAFEILGESPGLAGRCFAVHLTLSEPAGDERARYLVIGIDPLLVFRHEDYEMLSHWDHPMQADPPGEPETDKANDETRKTG